MRPAISFHPGFSLSMLSREALAVLGREWLLHGHLQDRIGMPLAHSGRSREEMQAIAIDEWMATSPVYSKRVQRALKFEGDNVETILKNLQCDIGSPHQFLDIRGTLVDQAHGEFFLAHCGALMDVEPMGEDYVHGMCHSIEDPTFDATAGATNPRAQVRPIHRPPRVPHDRQPVCHWTVTIDESFPAVSPHPNVALVQSSLAGQCVVEDPAQSAEPGGWDDYAGPFDPDFQFEDLSHRALVIILQEVAIQSHLLLRSFCLAVAERADTDAAVNMAAQMAVGLGGVTAERLARAFQLRGDAEGLAALLQIHPFFWPRAYVHPVIDVTSDATVRFSLLDHSPIFAEGDDFTWLASFSGSSGRALASIARGFDRRAAIRQVSPRPGERWAYELWIDDSAEPSEPDLEMSLIKLSTGAHFQFTRRRALRP
jgi:hypothetical protein